MRKTAIQGKTAVRFWKKQSKWPLLLFLFSAAAIFVAVNFLPVLASPPGSMYFPGETLNPNCSPDDPNCGVAFIYSTSTFGSLAVTNTLKVYSSVTSTFTAGLETTYLNVTGNAATSTFANGIELAGGCFKDRSGNCIVSAGSYLPLAGGTMTGVINAWPGVIMGSSTIGILNVTSSLMLGRVENYNYGKFYIDSSGNLNASGTLQIYGGATSTFSAGLQSTALNITGNTTSTFNNGIDLANGCFSVRGTCVSGGGGGSGTVGSGAIGQIAYYDAGGAAVAGTSTVFIHTNGKVGIGTTSPRYKLDVSGEGNSLSQLHFSYDGNDSGGYIVSASENNFFLSAGSSWNGSSWVAKSTSASLIGGAGTAVGDLAFYTDTGLTTGGSYTPSLRMVILNNGNIGIGNRTPANKLTVVGNIGVGNGTVTSTLAANYLAIATSTADRLGKFYVDSSGNVSASGTITATGIAYAPSYQASNASATSTFAGGLAIETSGLVYDWQTNNVGIGTNSPQALLHVYDVAYTKSFIVGDNVTTIDDNKVGFRVSPYSNGNVYIDTKTYSGGYTYFRTGQGTELSATRTWLSINSSNGFVGFGTTAPTNKLTVVGNLEVGNGTVTSTLAPTFLAIATSTANRLGIFYVDSSGNVNASGTLNLSATSVTSTFAGGLTLETSGLVYDWYTNRVGIGTASPLTALNISGTRPFFTISDSSAGTDKKNWYLSSQGGNLYIGTSTDANASATSTYLSIKDMGDISFGNDGLYYEATTSITYINNLETGAMSFDDDAGIINWINLPVVGTTAGLEMSYTAQVDENDLLILYGKTDGAGGVSNIGVGVGTSSPYAILDVMHKFTVASNTGDVFTSGTIRVYGNTTSTFSAGIQSTALNITGNTTSTFANGIDLANGCFSIDGVCVSGGGGGSGTVSNSTAGYLAYYDTAGTTVSGTTTIFMSPARLVGIGTTAPSDKLTIVGGDVVVGDGSTSSTYSKNNIIVGKATNYNTGIFYVNSSGNVSASGSLQVFGNVTSTGIAYAPTFQASSASATSTFAGGLAIETSGFVYDWYTNNVGIGTASPGADLEISQSAAPELRLNWGANTSFGLLRFMEGTTEIGTFQAIGTNFSTIDRRNDFEFNATNGDISFWPGNLQSVVYKSNGFVGIGTSNPTNKLTVVGNIEAGNGAATSTLAPTFLAIATSTANRLGIFYVDSSGNVSASGSLKVYGNVTSTGIAYAPSFQASNASATSTFAGGLTLETSGLVYDWYTNRVGIGTASPLTALNISGVRPFFTISDSSAGTDKKNWYLSSQGGNFYIGTSTDANPSATSTYLSIKDMGDISFGNDGLYYEATTTITYINSLETGNLNFDNDAGMVNWIDMDVTTLSASDTLHSYTAFMDGNPMLMIWGASDSAGYTSSTGISIATSTTSTYKLYIDGGSMYNPGLGVNGYVRATGFVTATGTLDLAESYPIDPDCADKGTCPMPGDVVCAVESPTTTFVVEKCSGSYNESLLGIVSTQPGFVLGDYDFKAGIYGVDYRVVALAGRVPLRVSTANGPIKKGDYLTSSNVPGIAMRATEPGRVVGVALQDFDDNKISDIGYQILDIGVTEGTVLTFVNPHWSIGSMNIEEISDEMPAEFGLLDRFTLAVKNALRKLGLVIQDGIAKVKSLHTDELCVGDTCVDEAKLKELLEKSNTSPSAPVIDLTTVEISTSALKILDIGY